MGIFKITKNDIDKRLDVFLSEKDEDISRSQWQKRIKAGGVLVNGREKAVHYFLREKDKIDLRFKIYDLRGEDKCRQGKDWLKRIKVIRGTDDYLVVNKPAGMVVHPDILNKGNTLVDWLIEQYPEIKGVGESEDRSGIVHRLDKDVSGLMVVARNQKMFDYLKKQFKSRKIFKEYTALVHKEMDQEEGEVKLPIKRSDKKGIFVADTNKELDSRSAVTKYEVIQKFRNYTLVKIRILTGRTHQIRVHMRSIGHAVVGDKLYMTHDIKKKKPVKLDRLWLYASRLRFKNLEGIDQEFQCEMPEELKEFLDDNKIK